MKFVAACLLAYLGAESAAAAEAAAAAAEGGDAPAPAVAPAAAAPSKEDVRRILGSVGAEVEEDRLDLLFAQLEGKDVAELLAAGREQLAYAPSGAAAAAAVVGVGGAPAAAGAGAAAAEDEKEEKEEDEEEDDEHLFNLFDDE